jgi:hypothetical protein
MKRWYGHEIWVDRFLNISEANLSPQKREYYEADGINLDTTASENVSSLHKYKCSSKYAVQVLTMFTAKP